MRFFRYIRKFLPDTSGTHLHILTNFRIDFLHKPQYTPRVLDKEMKKEGYPLLDNYKSLKIGLFLDVAFFTLIVIGIIGIIGYGLDLLFNTYPTLLIIGLFAGYPITILILRKRYKKFAEKKLKEEENGKT